MERGKEKEGSRIRFTRNMEALFFLFAAIPPPPLPLHVGSGDRRISDDVKRMKASRDRIVDSISPTNIDVVIFSLLRGR